jgi:hypothetical protein
VYACHFNTLFSAGSMVYTQRLVTGGLQDMAFLLNNYYSPLLAGVFISALGLLSILGLLGRFGYLTNALLWLLVLNLNNYLYASLTAGDYLLNQLLFFNIFFCAKQFSKPFFNDLKNAFHNMALAGIKIQVCLAYVLAAWFKLADADWLNGMAVYHTFQVPEYSNALLMSLPLWLCIGLNYATMAYQLLFPFTIWFRPFKIYLLAFGIIQHLVIAFCMGMFGFGIIMIICYILFLKYDESSADHADAR